VLGLLYWGTWRMCKGRLWRWAPLSIGAPVGNMEGGLYTSGFERWMMEGSRSGASLSPRVLYEGNLKGGLLYWRPHRIS